MRSFLYIGTYIMIHNSKNVKFLSKTQDSCVVYKMINQKAWSHVGECMSVNVSDYSQQMYHSL